MTVRREGITVAREQRPPTADLEMSRTGGIYALPVIGAPLTEVRRFYDELEPTAEDSPGVAAGKNALRYGTVVATGVAATAAAAIVCL